MSASKRKLAAALKIGQEREMFLGGRNYRNKVRIVKTHAELDLPKEIKINNKTFYSHRYKKIGKRSGTTMH